MANEEGVKIVITAEDRFSETIKKIKASTTLFGETAKNTKDYIAALQKEMVRLVANGLDPADQKIVEMRTDLDKLTKSFNGAGDSIKKSNMQWTNLALVVQDLPYGFRGIQNNLPALLGGIAGAAGAIYFIGSALIAFTTAYEKEITAFIYGITNVDSAQQKLNVAVAEGIGQAKAETASNESLLIIINDVTKSTTERKDALDALKEKYKGNIELQKTDITDGAKLIEITNKISDALLRKARAETLSKLIAEEEANVYKLQNAKGEQVVKNLGFLGTTYGLIKSAGNGVTTSMNIVNDAFDYQADAIKVSQDNISIYTQKLNENSLAIIKNKDAQSIGAKGPKTGPKQKVDDYFEKQARAEFEFYKNSLFQAEYYFNQLNEIEKINALMKATIDGASADELFAIQQTYEQNSINFSKQIEDKKFAIRQQSFERSKKLTEQYTKEAEDASKKANDRDLQNSLDSLKIQSDVETKLLLKGGKTTAAARIQILEDYKNKLYDLASVGGYTADQFDKIDDALIRVDAAIKGSKDSVKDFGVSWQDTLNGVNTVIMDFVNNSMFALGDSIGKALAGENVDLINTFGMLLADALQAIGKQLIALATATLFAWALLANPSPVTAGLALAAGIAAVALGSYLKSTLTKKQTGGATKFANGGIVSGPTMGLMGEYPGASSNPEVIAPLDKLKGLIGGADSLEARISGNDLLILMNKAQRNNNVSF